MTRAADTSRYMHEGFPMADDTARSGGFPKRLLISPAILLLYALSHVYHLAHFRVRSTVGTFMRDSMETIQAPMILTRLFAPFVGVFVAVWVLSTTAYKKTAISFLAAMIVASFVSLPYLQRFLDL